MFSCYAWVNQYKGCCYQEQHIPCKMPFLVLLCMLSAIAANQKFFRERLSNCIGHPANTLHDFAQQLLICYNLAFQHCIHDTIVYKNDKQSMLKDNCGYIHLENFNIHTYTWYIETPRTVWLDILVFQLYFYQLPCRSEFISVEDMNSEYLYCGKREPWKMYSRNSVILIHFHSNRMLLE